MIQTILKNKPNPNYDYDILNLQKINQKNNDLEV